MEQVFEWTFVWVNKGEWRSTSSEQSAINEANYQAILNDINTYDIVRTVIDKIPCPDNHREMCDHLTVTLYGERR
jgi:hypothetical protein